MAPDAKAPDSSTAPERDHAHPIGSSHCPSPRCKNRQTTMAKPIYNGAPVRIPSGSMATETAPLNTLPRTGRCAKNNAIKASECAHDGEHHTNNYRTIDTRPDCLPKSKSKKSGNKECTFRRGRRHFPTAHVPANLTRFSLELDYPQPAAFPLSLLPHQDSNLE